MRLSLGEGIAEIIAQSWELTDATTMVLHIRKVAHFRNKPPANVREVNAKMETMRRLGFIRY
jgi:hypothetical protein